MELSKTLMIESDELTHLSPNELVRRSLDGSQSASEELVRRYTPRLRMLLKQRLRNHSHEVDDIIQESFARAFCNLKQFDFRFQFSTWLYTIGIRLAIDFLRHASRATSPSLMNDMSLIVDNCVNTGIDSADSGNVWHVAQQVLSTVQFEALWLRYGEDLQINEIARVMQRTQISTRVLLHRARNLLSQHVSP